MGPDDFVGTWWIDELFLLGASNPSDDVLERLRREGFGAIICLLDQDQQSPRYDPRRARSLGYVVHNIPVRDFQPPSLAQLQEFVTLVRSAGPGVKLIVHCEGGTGRTGTMAAAYWIAKGFSPAQAIAKVRKARPGAVETPEQQAVLIEFGKSPGSPESGRTRR